MASPIDEVWRGGFAMKKIVVRKAGTVRLTTAAAFYDDPCCPVEV
jgi:hypothetical protein